MHGETVKFTLALFNTHTALPVAMLLTSRHTAKTNSHGYHCSSPTAFMTHIAQR